MPNSLHDVQRVCSMLEHAAFVSLDTEFFNGYVSALGPLAAPADVLQEFNTAGADSYIAQLGLTVAVPKAEAPAAAPHTFAVGDRTVAVPRADQLDFATFTFLVSPPLHTRSAFTLDTLRFLTENNFDLLEWVRECIPCVHEAPETIEGLVSAWTQYSDGAGALAAARTQGRGDDEAAAALAGALGEIFAQADGESPFTSGALYRATVPLGNVSLLPDVVQRAARFMRDLEYSSARETGDGLYASVVGQAGAVHLEAVVGRLRDCAWALLPTGETVLNSMAYYRGAPTKNLRGELDIAFYASAADRSAALDEVAAGCRRVLLGVRPIIDAITTHRVPLVLFSGMSDVLLTLRTVVDRGITELPPAELVRRLHAHFPCLYDLSILVRAQPIRTYLRDRHDVRSLSLGALYKATDHLALPRAADGSAAHHDAGYDSLMTGLLFSWLLRMLMAAPEAGDAPGRRGPRARSAVSPEALHDALVMTCDSLYIHNTVENLDLCDKSSVYQTFVVQTTQGGDIYTLLRPLMQRAQPVGAGSSPAGSRASLLQAARSPKPGVYYVRFPQCGKLVVFTSTLTAYLRRELGADTGAATSTETGVEGRGGSSMRIPLENPSGKIMTICEARTHPSLFSV